MVSNGQPGYVWCDVWISIPSSWYSSKQLFVQFFRLKNPTNEPTAPRQFDLQGNLVNTYKILNFGCQCKCNLMVFVCQQTGNEYRYLEIMSVIPSLRSRASSERSEGSVQSGRPTPVFEWFGFLLVAINSAAFDTIERLRGGKAAALARNGKAPPLP